MSSENMSDRLAAPKRCRVTTGFDSSIESMECTYSTRSRDSWVESIKIRCRFKRCDGQSSVILAMRLGPVPGGGGGRRAEMMMMMMMMMMMIRALREQCPSGVKRPMGSKERKS